MRTVSLWIVLLAYALALSGYITYDQWPRERTVITPDPLVLKDWVVEKDHRKRQGRAIPYMLQRTVTSGGITLGGPGSSSSSPTYSGQVNALSFRAFGVAPPTNPGVTMASGSAGNMLLAPEISAANAGTTPLTASVLIAPTNALDVGDYVLSINTQASGTSLFNVTYGGVTTTYSSITWGAGSAAPGSLSASGGGATLTTYALSGGNSYFTVYGNQTDSATAKGVALDTINTFSTAGAKLVSIRNGGTEKAYIDKDGQAFASMGTGAVATLPMQGTLVVNTTGVGNVGASGPDDLQVYTMPANTLIATGRCVHAIARGTLANNTNSKTVRMTIGPTPTALITKVLGALAVATGTWSIDCTICRTSASNQDYYCEASNNEGTTVSGTDGTTVLFESTFGTLTQTETNALDIKTQSTVSTSNNDIVSEMLIVETK